MKVERNGQAEILTKEQLQESFDYLSPKYRAIFAICLFTGCRISEALSLKADDIANGVVVIRKSNTKGKLKTREIGVNPQLQAYLDGADLPTTGYIFPSNRDTNKPMSSQAADQVLRKYCDYLGYEGVSTHSFRRTALTMMSASGIPLRTIQEISGHASLATLQRYLEVTPNQKKEAIAAISF